MPLAHLDCFSGVSGDMWVGALLDLGLPLDELAAAIATLPLNGVRLHAERVRRGGLMGTHFRVEEPPGAPQPHRHLSDVLAILQGGALPASVVERASAVFRRIGEVEAAAHGVSIEAVHFHEVGAVDTIVDIVAVLLGCHLLGISSITCSTVTTGFGTVACAHGTMPVPAPATAALLHGVPTRPGSVAGECTTPTGAALLRELVDAFEPDRCWVTDRCGYGAGTRDDEARPNLLRIALGRAVAQASESVLDELSLQVDTATGEELAFLIDGVLARGAVDCFATPVQMKKGRPGWSITSLVDPAHRETIAAFLLEESTSLGLRYRRVERVVLERWQEVRDTPLGAVQFKVARLPSGRVVQRPEDGEVRRLVGETGRSRREIVAVLLGVGG
ncbi:MAG: nickel pincer cofactor biosynthesis protein LarC [Planctomycetes bacterium]|nr:nickel pincer cofactor biosynthesis protein LarC [Planctomycetota bacterium]MCB9868771.1 nickel pincer cofactor biosynthesis protein LarC [Planctomycetota bacterium]